MEFYRNRKKSVNLILICSAILLVLIVVFLYSIGLFSDIISAKLAGISGVFALILAIVIIKMLFSSRDPSPLLVLNKEGITARTTAMSKAAGLILWQDIIDVSINKVGWDTLITLTIDKPENYIPIIRKKLSALAVSGAEDAQGNLLVYLTTSELDLEAQELFSVITKYRDNINSTKISIF